MRSFPNVFIAASTLVFCFGAAYASVATGWQNTVIGVVLALAGAFLVALAVEYKRGAGE